jgi:putative flippase GtrA
MENIICLLKRLFKNKFFRYVIIGGSATLIDWIVFYLLITKFNIYYQISLFLSFILATSFHFIFSKIFVFESKSKKVLLEICKFLSVAIFSLFMSSIFMYIFVEVIIIEKMISKIITSGLLLFINYNLNKRITFK